MKRIFIVSAGRKFKDYRDFPRVGKGIIDNEAVDLISQRYEAYIEKVSSPSMAVSLECAQFLYNFCETINPRKILDLGSGFSSFVFRLYQRNNQGVEVVSVDDDPDWTQRTREFLNESRVRADSLFELSDFLQRDPGSFDLIFLDLNFVEVRKRFILPSFKWCRNNGCVIFDDVHKQEFLFEVLHQTRNLQVDFFDIKAQTLDRFGRYSLLGRKRG